MNAVSPEVFKKIAARMAQINSRNAMIGASPVQTLALQGCQCGPKLGGGAYPGYAGAGALTIVSAGAGTQVPGTLTVQGRELPADSIILFVASLTAVGGSVATARITQILVDDQPMYIGSNGVFVASLDSRNLTGLAQRVGATATRTLTIVVTFGAASVAGDTVCLQIARRGELSQQVPSCNT